MSGLNKLLLIGNLGEDPELRTTEGGQQVCNFSVACNESWTNKEGEKQEHTEWTRVIVWGKQGEACAKHLKRGRQVFVEGRKRTRKWQDKEGNPRKEVECIATDVQFLGGKKDGDQQSHRDDDIAF